ncbi:platelet-activating factor acetylhydrolase, isoform II-domain-containing protein [Coprinopsis sp. MPI-PUGE-AT-0042]|nr:platelet-activating factor acetylhydrolase, isoform II-domain-containing protein [Coprinopsis sp. MPI-PUGE-AT-0042]
MLFLPSIQGRFPVGITTFVAPVKSPRPIGNVKLRKPHKTRPSHHNSALYLEEVAFTAYYPADTSSKPTKQGVDWLIRPVRESLQGFSTFLGWPAWILWPVVYLFGSLVKIPAYRNAPLLHPSRSDWSTEQWPLVIFSHGLGGSRTAYSQFCSRVAATGRVVIALEHRDGTGTIAIPGTWSSKSEQEHMYYLREEDIYWEDEHHKDASSPYPLRVEQLAFRQHEVYTAFNAFRDFIRNEPDSQLRVVDSSNLDRESWGLDAQYTQPLVGFDQDVVLAGHSFGGCTVLSILSSTPPPEYLRIPVGRAIILDPWLEPLPIPAPVSPGSSTRSAAESVHSNLEDNGIRSSDHPAHPPMLVINSETFTLWKDHFARLQGIIKDWTPGGGRIVTLVDSKHISFSDFPVLPLLGRRIAKDIFGTIADISVGFLDDRFEETLEKVKTRKMEITIIGKKKDGRPKRKLVGEPGDVIVE